MARCTCSYKGGCVLTGAGTTDLDKLLGNFTGLLDEGPCGSLHSDSGGVNCSGSCGSHANSGGVNSGSCNHADSGGRNGCGCSGPTFGHADSQAINHACAGHADSYGTNCGGYAHADSCGINYASYGHADAGGCNCGTSGHADSGATNCGSYGHANSGGVNCGQYGHADSCGCSMCCGSQAHGPGALAYRRGSTAHAAAKITYRGDAQYQRLTANRQTITATPLEVYLDGATLQATLPARGTWQFVLQVAAYNTTDNTGAAWCFRGAIRRDAAGGTAILGTTLKDSFADAGMAATDVAVSADDTNDALKILVTGLASKTINWSAVMHLAEVCGGAPS